MKKADFDELKNILTDVNSQLGEIKNRLTTLESNQKVYNSKVDSWDTDFKDIRRAVTAVEVVCGETQRQVQQIHAGTIDTTSKLGARVRKLEVVKDTPSGRRRPAK